MGVIMQGILGCFIGCAILMFFYATLYCYREMKFKKEMAELERKPSADRKRDSSKPDKTLANMRNVFSELRKAQVKTDPNEPKFGQGWFSYKLLRDLEEMKRQRGQHHDKTS